MSVPRATAGATAYRALCCWFFTMRPSLKGAASDSPREGTHKCGGGKPPVPGRPCPAAHPRPSCIHQVLGPLVTCPHQVRLHLLHACLSHRQDWGQQNVPRGLPRLQMSSSLPTLSGSHAGTSRGSMELGQPHRELHFLFLPTDTVPRTETHWWQLGRWVLRRSLEDSPCLETRI